MTQRQRLINSLIDVFPDLEKDDQINLLKEILKHLPDTALVQIAPPEVLQ